MPKEAGSQTLRVLIASPLEAEHVERIAAAEPERIEVLYAPELLGTPRYIADHSGAPRDRTEPERQRWADLLSQADILFDFDHDAGADLPNRAPNVRWIQATSAGIGEYVRRIGLAKDSIILTTAAGVHAQPLAEFALMGMLYFAKEVPMLQRRQAEHFWERYCGHELAGSRVLIVGLGAVGRRTAELCAAFGMTVTGLRRSASSELSPGVDAMIDFSKLDLELERTEYLVISAPGTPETIRMIDARRLGLLPPGAVLINIGRGSIVEEAALIEALRSARLRGAALDVFEKEPLPPQSPLWDMPNVLVSPHSASTVDRENERIVDIFIENLHRYLDGRPLLNRFDYDRQY
jgi:glyoxylate/hydroxypyruvate reductase